MRGADVHAAERAQVAYSEREFRRGEVLALRIQAGREHFEAVGGINLAGQAREVAGGQAEQGIVRSEERVGSRDVGELAGVECYDNAAPALQGSGLPKEVAVALHGHRHGDPVDAVWSEPHASPPAAGAEWDQLIERVEQESGLPVPDVLANCAGQRGVLWG